VTGLVVFFKLDGLAVNFCMEGYFVELYRFDSGSLAGIGIIDISTIYGTGRSVFWSVF
jgi:hypothetical protein